jgi:hypothetical protein
LFEVKLKYSEVAVKASEVEVKTWEVIATEVFLSAKAGVVIYDPTETM